MDAALYTIVLVPPLALIFGSRCLTRIVLLCFCLPPTIIAFRSEQTDIFWPRFWLLVGLVSNSGIRGWLRAAFISWCAMPCSRNGTHLIFDLATLRILKSDPGVTLYTAAYQITGNSFITSFLASFV